ncbi:MAG: dihydropyrimidinase [Sneathiellaceae bacterium]
MDAFDLVIHNARIATAADVFDGDIGIADGRIAALARRLDGGRERIDAEGRTVTPGGVDGHIHLEQRLPDGAEICDDFFSGTRSAACGGTTTIIPFAFQGPGQSLRDVLAAYRESAADRCFVDYAFHAILTDPTPQVLNQELPSLVMEGYTSFKLYMTYRGLQLTDRQVLDVLTAMRREKTIAMVHAENAEFIEWLTDRLVDAGLTAPRNHTRAHPKIGEREATHRALSMSEMVGVPFVLVHISAREVVEQLDWARARGLTVFGETCPQYLTLTEDDYGEDGAFEGTKLICTPPPRTVDDQEALWAAMARNAIDIVSSDHSPFRYAGSKGKQIHGTKAGFHKIPNGVPGVETRMPLLYSEGVLKGRIDLPQFVRLTAQNAAKIYGLYPRKGTIAVGSDADLVIWGTTPVTVANASLHHDCDYTPYEGMTLGAWPATVFSRGRPVYRDGQLCGEAGHGDFLPAARPEAMQRPGKSAIADLL